MKNLAIIQARVGSSRLRGKVLLEIEGKPVIEHVVSRVRNSKLIDEIVVATSNTPDNLPLIEKCANLGVLVFTGSENDVLSRYYHAATQFGPKNIIRITADCPLHDSAVIDKVVHTHLEVKADYTSNTQPPTYPDGLDVEIFTYQALAEAMQNAISKSDREHVTPYIIANPKFVKINVTNDIDLSGYRWTLDEARDFEFIKTVYANLYENNQLFGMSEIVTFLERNKELQKINLDIKRNAGYKKSL